MLSPAHRLHLHRRGSPSPSTAHPITPRPPRPLGFANSRRPSHIPRFLRQQRRHSGRLRGPGAPRFSARLARTVQFAALWNAHVHAPRCWRHGMLSRFTCACALTDSSQISPGPLHPHIDRLRLIPLSPLVRAAPHTSVIAQRRYRLVAGVRVRRVRTSRFRHHPRPRICGWLESRTARAARGCCAAW